MKKIIIISFLSRILIVFFLISIPLMSMNTGHNIQKKEERIDPVLDEKIFRLPSDIMRVEFKKEIWVYRLRKDRTVIKIIINKESKDERPNS